jgi:hypothetical protein
MSRSNAIHLPDFLIEILIQSEEYAMTNQLKDNASPVLYRDILLENLRDHLNLCMACHVSTDELFSNEFLDKFTYEQLLTTCDLLAHGLAMVHQQRGNISSFELPEEPVL